MIDMGIRKLTDFPYCEGFYSNGWGHANEVVNIS